MECCPILRVMEESENGDGVARRIHAIKDDERCPCDPSLVETLLIEVSTRIGMSRRNLDRNASTRANVLSASCCPKRLTPCCSWFAMSASTHTERATFMPA